MSDTVKMATEQNIGWRVLFQKGVGGRLAILCLGVWLHAANSMLAATTLPSAVREFGGDEYIGWAFALYLLGSILAGSGTGLLVRHNSLRKALSLTAGFYLVGTVICAVAPDMLVVLVGRFVQGIGGGFLVALTYVAIGKWFDRGLTPVLMALVSAVWSMSAFCGPVIGGTFATFGHWRMAFWAFVVQTLVFIVLTLIIMPQEEIGKTVGKLRLPGKRLFLISISILSVAFASININIILSPLLVVFAVDAMWLAFRVDASCVNDRMFPSDPMSIRKPVGAGLVFVLMASIATMSFLVYGPVLLETIHGVTPLSAGYIVAVESIGWGIAAVIVAGKAVKYETQLIRCGAITITVGLIGFAIFMQSGPLWVIVLCVLAQGVGLGIMWGSIVKRITETAQPNENDVRSSSIPTVQQMGFAFGAAAAGIVANASGFADGVTDAAAGQAATWIFSAFVPFAIVACVAVWRMSTGKLEQA